MELNEIPGLVVMKFQPGLFLYEETKLSAAVHGYLERPDQINDLKNLAKRGELSSLHQSVQRS